MGGDLAAASPNALEHDERAIWLRAKRIDGGGMMRDRAQIGALWGLTKGGNGLTFRVS